MVRNATQSQAHHQGILSPGRHQQVGILLHHHQSIGALYLLKCLCDAGDEITIAYFANWAWVRTHNWSGASVEGLEHLMRWVNELYERPGCAAGIRKPERPGSSDDLVKSAQTMVTR